MDTILFNNPPSSPFSKGGIEGDFDKGGLYSPLSGVRGVFPTLEKGGEGGFSVEQPGAIAIDPVTNTALISHKDGIAIIKLENSVPKIDLLIPNSARSGDSGLILSVEGAQFIKDSQTQFNKKDVPTYFKTNESLQAHISQEDLTTSGNVPVTVTNPSPGGGISNTLKFSIFDPAPVLDSISPDTLYLTPDSKLIIPNNPLYSPLSRGVRGVFPPLEKGGEGGLLVSLRVRGKNFFNGSTVNLNGENLKTKFISSILLEAEITSSIISSIGKYPVVVINPSPGAYTSNPLYLNVVEETTATQMSSQPPSPLSLHPEVSGEAISNNEILLPKLRHQNDSQGAGTLTGRILNTKKEPIEGVTIKIK
ncbi:MAG: hypothetical protein HY752_04725, partial [Nitrospirae bacterium]|nr:hypothetical protein [Nitrospirota bacterium]